MRRALALALVGSALAGLPAMAKRPSPPLRGVVEGYYGRPWTGAARRDVIGFMGAHGLDTFVYGPKNDGYHRDRWRDLYPDDALADFRATVKAARRARVTFVVALSPAKDICYACRDDFRALTRKLAQLRRAGVRHFALFYDDVFGGLTRPEDIARYGGTDQESLARAHADLANRTDRWLRSRGLPGLVLVVPSDYAGTECHPYHDVFGRKLRPRIAIGWTGSGVFAPTLTGAEARAFRACVHDRPIVLWDNFPVNDGILSSNLHLGPLTGRDADLVRAVRGHLLNPMTQAHASLIGLGTAAAYFADPAGYDPEAAWRAALAELDPSGGLAVLAEQTRSSPLDLDDAVALGAAVDSVAASFAGADWQAPVAALEAEIARQLAAPATIATSLGGTPLGDEIAPWVAELAAHMAVETQAVAFLRALKPALADVVAGVEGGMLHASGRALPPDATVQADLAPGFAVPPVVPTAPELVECLGGIDGILSSDIPFCPELGLNVHGKRLYVVPYSFSVIETITGRNVHQRFLELVAARWADFQSREAPGSTALALTIDGAPVPLAPNGDFDVTIAVPAGGAATLVLTTAAGDATSRVVP
jgi:hyaluronoglucosaminidase